MQAQATITVYSHMLQEIKHIAWLWNLPLSFWTKPWMISVLHDECCKPIHGCSRSKMYFYWTLEWLSNSKNFTMFHMFFNLCGKTKERSCSVWQQHRTGGLSCSWLTIKSSYLLSAGEWGVKGVHLLNKTLLIKLPWCLEHKKEKELLNTH